MKLKNFDNPSFKYRYAYICHSLCLISFNGDMNVFYKIYYCACMINLQNFDNSGVLNIGMHIFQSTPDFSQNHTICTASCYLHQ